MNRPFAPAIALMIMICGCGSSSFLNNRLEEGVIEYALSFPEYDPNGIMGGMLPERTTLSFNKDMQVAELSAGMGIFRTSMITNNKARAMDYHMSMMSRKIVARMQPRDLELFNTDREKPTIIYTQDTDTIAGYPCRLAIAIFDEIDHPEIELWYTDKIQMKDPNWFGPFSEIPGVLLRYDLIQHGIRMRLDAISITEGPVDPAKFKLKEEYQIVPPTTLHQELAEVLGTFSM
jgi:GLPGLI family protein